jgi:hypothetical protein
MLNIPEHLSRKRLRQIKSPPGKSEELLNMMKTILSIYLTYLFPIFIGMELAPFLILKWIGCQGFIGPFPQPFLISDAKNYCKNTSQNINANFLCVE